VLVAVLSSPVHAYIGPGVGVTMIGWFLGVVIALAAGAGAVIVWPVRSFLRRLRDRREATATSDTPANTTDRAA
jgi:hypothetical protein